MTENEVEWKRACEREVGCPLVSAGCGVVIFFYTAIRVSHLLFRPAILVLLFPRVVTGGNKGEEGNFVRGRWGGRLSVQVVLSANLPSFLFMRVSAGGSGRRRCRAGVGAW